MFPLFRKTVEKIITQVGCVPLDCFYESEEQTIVLEKENIFVFRIHEGVWYPKACEQVLLHTHIGDLSELMRYHYRPGTLRDVKSFASACAREWQAYYLK